VYYCVLNCLDILNELNTHIPSVSKEREAEELESAVKKICLFLMSICNFLNILITKSV